jgi:thiol-disulfide isomerase/thioredoxin
MKRILLAALSVLGIGSIAAAVGIPAIADTNNSNNNPPFTMQAAEAQTTKLLAQQVQAKPKVVKIYADWCPACQKLKPIMASLQQQYGDSANFIVFDVSDRATTQASEAKAQQLGLGDFFTAHKSQTATIAVINPSNGQTIEQFRKNFDRQDYVNAIDSAIAMARR